MLKISRKWIIPGCLIVVLILSGGLSIALAAREGTAEDPLITKGYIDGVFKPEIYGIINTAINDIANNETADIQELIDAYVQQITEKANEMNLMIEYTENNDSFVSALKAAVREKLLGIEQITTAETQFYRTVTLETGEQFIGDIGCEIILRSGEAKCISNNGEGLINVPHASGLSNNALLAKNTLYITSNSGAGLSASSQVILLVKGKQILH